MRIIDTEEYISMHLEQGITVQLPVEGNSMLPFLIHGRDSITLSPLTPPLQPGDIVLFRRPCGDYILHRICKISDAGIFCIGDAQQLAEGPIDPDCILAKATSVCRKGKNLTPGCFWWEFFEHIWLRLIPCRHFIMRLYGIRIPVRKGVGPNA